MKAYRVTLHITDHDELGAEEIGSVLENSRYPNHCMYPRVIGTEEADIGKWCDDHPLNRSSTDLRAWWEARHPAGASTTTPPEGATPPSGPALLRCYVCGAPATCIGRYEGHGPVRGGCDEHCAHGNEDGWCCDPEDEPMGDGLAETAIALQEAEARLADERLRVALWSGAPVEGWEQATGGYCRVVGDRVATLIRPPEPDEAWVWEGDAPKAPDAQGFDPDPLACKNAAEAWLLEAPHAR